MIFCKTFWYWFCWVSISSGFKVPIQSIHSCIGAGASASAKDYANGSSFFYKNKMGDTHYSKQLSCNENGTAILFIHGFGANHLHWMSNMDALSEYYDTYALDLFGFGNSSQDIDFPYTIDFWYEQVISFIEYVIQKPCILVGNSLGGYISLYTLVRVQAAVQANAAVQAELKGVVLINPVILSKNKPLVDPNSWWLKKWVVHSYFHFLKNKKTILSILKQLYPVAPNRVLTNSILLDSISYSASRKNASTVFYKIMYENVIVPSVFIEDLVLQAKVKEKLVKPLLFIYGEKDEWIHPKETLEPMKDWVSHVGPIEIVPLDAGHCPHDEIPEVVNQLLYNFCLGTNSNAIEN